MGSKINVVHFFSEKRFIGFFRNWSDSSVFLGSKKNEAFEAKLWLKASSAAAALLGMPLPLTALENNGLESLWTATTHNLLILAQDILKALMGAK